MTAQGLSQSREPRPIFAGAGIAGKKALGLERARRIQLLVEVGLQKERAILLLVPAHCDTLPSRSISSERARASRDITVPIGAPVASAI